MGWQPELEKLNKNLPQNLLGWGYIAAVKIVGILLTTIAVSLGAPFWFDMLNKLVNLRSTGVKPKKSEDKEKEEAS